MKKKKTQRVLITLTDVGDDFKATIEYEPSPSERNSPSINAGVRLALIICSGHNDLMEPLVPKR